MLAKKTRTEKDNTERYLLTYADLMNLLLILFIILYSMATIDIAKFNELATSLKQAFGDSSAASFISQGSFGNSLIQMDANAPSPVIPAKLEEQQMEVVKETVSEIVQKENLKGEVDVTLQERGVVISIKERVLFKRGSASIEENSKQTLEKIGKVLLSIPGNHIRVEGHTDSDPINTPQFPSNWELSAARATNVLRFLVEKDRINPKIISAVGYGEYAPKFPNDTDEHKAANRRVDIVILKNIFSKSEAGVDNNTEKTIGQDMANNAEMNTSGEDTVSKNEKVEIRLDDFKYSGSDTSSGQAQALEKIREVIKTNPGTKVILVEWNVLFDNSMRRQAVVYNRDRKTFSNYIKQDGEKQWTRYEYSNITDEIINKAIYIGQGFGKEKAEKVDNIE